MKRDVFTLAYGLMHSSRRLLYTERKGRHIFLSVRDLVSELNRWADFLKRVHRKHSRKVAEQFLFPTVLIYEGYE